MPPIRTSLDLLQGHDLRDRGPQRAEEDHLPGPVGRRREPVRRAVPHQATGRGLPGHAHHRGPERRRIQHRDRPARVHGTRAPGRLLLPARPGLHRVGVARGRGQDPRVDHRSPHPGGPRRGPGPAWSSQTPTCCGGLCGSSSTKAATRASWTRRSEGHRVDHQGVPAGQRLRRRVRGLRRARRPGGQPGRQALRPHVLLPAPPRAAPHPRLRGPQEAARQEPAEQRQPARRLDTRRKPRTTPWTRARWEARR